MPDRIAKTTGSIVLSSRGVVRGFTNWGTFLLPKPIPQVGATSQSATKYHTGHYFIMRFDASPKTQHVIRKTLGLDPRLLRHSVVKMGTKLEDIKDIPGVAPWSGESS